MRGRKTNGQFTSEGLKGNQYAKNNPPNKTSFKSVPPEKHPSWKGGLQKHHDGYFISLANNKRMKRSRFVWMGANGGKIPKGGIIYHINGDIYDDSLENLELITRAELLKRNQNK